MDDVPERERTSTDPSPTPAEPDDPIDSIESVDLDESLVGRVAPLKRLAQMAVILAPLLIAGFLLVRSALPSLTARTAPATPTLNLPNAPLTIISNVSFGTLTLNGTRLTGPLPRQVKLRTGLNTLTLSAPPFTPRTCTVRGPIIAVSSNASAGSVSAGQSDLCDLSVQSTGDGASELILSMGFSGSDLPAAQLDQARRAISNALAASTPRRDTVPTGQLFATGLDGSRLPTSQRATEPLTASISYGIYVPDPANFPGDSGFPCTSGLCAQFVDSSQPLPANTWLLTVPLDQSWRFTTADGDTVSAVQFVDSGQTTLTLTYTRASGWRVAAGFYEVPGGAVQPMPTFDGCDTGTQMLYLALAPVSQSSGAGGGVTASPAANGQLPACVMVLQQQDGTPLAHYIWRFGVLSAGDAEAQALIPSLPLASPAECDAVGL